jgi:hypothetical protein
MKNMRRKKGFNRRFKKRLNLLQKGLIADIQIFNNVSVEILNC